jgi:hypothetical protein
MTLILACLNPKNAIVVADRRRTSPGGGFQDDESAKGALLVCDDGRLAVAYTGLARTTRFDTEEWLLRALLAGAAGASRVEHTIARFTELATERFARLPISAIDMRLSVVGVGFEVGPGGTPQPIAVRVTNSEPFKKPIQASASGEFESTILRVKPGGEPVHVFAAGIAAGLDNRGMERLRQMTAEERPSHAIVNKAIEVLQAAADSPKSRGTVSKQGNSVVVDSTTLDADPELGDYFAGINSRTAHFANLVDTRSGAGHAIKGASLGVAPGHTGRPIIVARSTSRNAQCPCGSGKKYKFCHGR